MTDYYQKIIFKDRIFRLLMINMILVILGYASAYAIGPWFVPFFRIFKLVFVFLSLIMVIFKNGFSTSNMVNSFSIYLVVIMVMLLSFFSDKPFVAVYKGLTFVFPFLYIFYTINYLSQYGSYKMLIYLSLMILISYSIVPLSFFVLGGSLELTNIYGYQEGAFFVSNHYGWSSAIFILAAFTILRHYPLAKFYKISLYILLPFVFYLLIISANRSGILSIIIAFVIFFLKDKFFSFSKKMILLIIALFIVGFISLQKDSSIDFLIERNEKQISSGNEGRLIGTNAMLKSFNANPVYWITGVGMFNYSELHKYGGILPVYHNSYWEILFGSGLMVFIFFVKIMIIDPIKVFWNKTSTYSLLAIPLLIIPFFESNITAGQFLFFPWFSYMLLLNCKEFKINSEIATGE